MQYRVTYRNKAGEGRFVSVRSGYYCETGNIDQASLLSGIVLLNAIDWAVFQGSFGDQYTPQIVLLPIH